MLPLFKDISPPPASYLASVFALTNNLQSSDPFEGSALSAFGHPTVGSALAARPAGEWLPYKMVLLWTLVCTGERPKKVLQDHVDQESGVSGPPTWPASIPQAQHFEDEDEAKKDLQGHWGMIALVLSKGIVHSEMAVLDAVCSGEENPNLRVQPFLPWRMRSIGPCHWVSERIFYRYLVQVLQAHCQRVCDQLLGKWLKALTI